MTECMHVLRIFLQVAAQLRCMHPRLLGLLGYAVAPDGTGR